MQFYKHSSRLVIIGFCFFSLFYFCYSFSILNNGHNWGGDFALYISQAKAIVNGNTNTLYEASKASCEGSFERMNPDVYPVIFPLMLSPIFAFLGVNFIAFKILIICCFVIVLCAVCFFVYKKLGSLEAILVVGLLATSDFFIVFNNNVLADVPAMMWVWISIIIYLFIEEKSIKFAVIKFSVLGLALGIAYQTKTLSISAVAAVLIAELINYLILKNTFKEMLIKITPFIIVFGSVFIFTHLVYPSSSNGYIQQSSKLTFQIVKDNILYYSNVPSWFLYDSSIFVWLTFSFAILGVYGRLKQNIFLVILTFVHLILLILWPYQQGLRFLIFLVPLYYYFACIGYIVFFKVLIKKTKFTRLYKVRFIVLFIIIFYSFVNSLKYHSLYKIQDNEIVSKEAKELFEFVITQTKSSDKFIFFKPNVLRLICNRESVYVFSKQAVITSKANYWIFKKGDKLADTTNLKMVLNNKEFLVFNLK